MTKEPTTSAPSATKIKVVAPPKGMYAVWSPSTDVELEGRVRLFFLALPSSTVVFDCELAICMEIDQSLRFKKSASCLSLYGLEDPNSLPIAHRV